MTTVECPYQNCGRVFIGLDPWRVYDRHVNEHRTEALRKVESQ
jgi:hypothetical protein